MKKILFSAIIAVLCVSAFGQLDITKRNITATQTVKGDTVKALDNLVVRDTTIYDLIKKHGGGVVTESDPVVKAVNGLIKSDGSNISAASAGVDYVEPASLSSYIPKSDTVQKVLTPWNSNLKGRLKYNNDTVIYLPTQGTSFFDGSMFFGNGGKNLQHSSSSQGWNNVGLGKNALLNVTIGAHNVAIGRDALINVTTGSNNFGYGLNSMLSLTTGSNNIGMMINSSRENITGSGNVCIGVGTGRYGKNNNNNVFIGTNAGFGSVNMESINASVKVGYNSGYSDTTDNRLFVENSNSQTPLVGGKFDLDQLGINMLITKPWNFTHNVGGSIGSGYVNTVSIDTVNGLKIISPTAGIIIPKTITATGTTGNQTINKASGSVNIAAGQTSITVTNSLVTDNSIVLAVCATNDATAYVKNVVPGAGSFVITLGAAATAETRINFLLTN